MNAAESGSMSARSQKIARRYSFTTVSEAVKEVHVSELDTSKPGSRKRMRSPEADEVGRSPAKRAAITPTATEGGRDGHSLPGGTP